MPNIIHKDINQVLIQIRMCKLVNHDNMWQANSATIHLFWWGTKMSWHSLLTEKCSR